MNLMRPICHINLSKGYRGGERQTELLVRQLSSRGLEQQLIARSGEPLAERIRGLPGLKVIEAHKPFTRYVAECRGTIVHAHEAHAAKLAYWARWAVGSPYVLTRRLGKRPGGNPLTRSVYRRAGKLVGVAQSVATGLADYTGRDDILVINSASSQLRVNDAASRRIRERWSDRFLIVNVAALVVRQKGQDVLLRAARDLQAVGSDIHFLLLGDGRDRGWLEQQASDLSNVTFEGFVDNLGDYLAAADAFVLPSRHEGIGGACLDALQFGLPVIASAVDGVPEVIRHETNGLLVPTGDHQALLDSISRVRNDRVLAAALRDQGRATAAVYAPRRMADQYFAVYQSLSGAGMGMSESCRGANQEGV